MRPSPASVVCIRCGTWYPAGTRRCPRDNTPLVRPETVTELVEESSSEVETICASCGQRYPAGARRCPKDGTPLVMPDTLIELLNPAKSSKRPVGSSSVTCVRCRRVYPAGTRRCPKDGTPLVNRSISPAKPAASRRPDELTPVAEVDPLAKSSAVDDLEGTADPPIAEQPTTDDADDLLTDLLATNINKAELISELKDTAPDGEPRVTLQEAADAEPSTEGDGDALPVSGLEEILPQTTPTGQRALAPTASEELMLEPALPPVEDGALPARQRRQRRLLLFVAAGFLALAACALLALLIGTLGDLGQREPTSVITSPDDPVTDGPPRELPIEVTPDAAPRADAGPLDGSLPPAITPAPPPKSGRDRPRRPVRLIPRTRTKTRPPTKTKAISPKKIKDPFGDNG